MTKQASKQAKGASATVPTSAPIHLEGTVSLTEKVFAFQSSSHTFVTFCYILVDQASCLSYGRLVSVFNQGRRCTSIFVG